MESTIKKFKFGPLAAGVAGVIGVTGACAAPAVHWQSVVNNGNVASASSGEVFFSYNQPSVNDRGLVVFRGRARNATGGGQGGGGEPLRGIITRDMSVSGAAINTIAANRGTASTVPAPNNQAATFTEFPAFPRIDARSDTVVFRGQSNPVLEYETSPGVSTKGGTSGIYSGTQGSLTTGASLLGNVSNPDLSHFQVPGTVPGTRFDQFPGAPTVTGNNVVFKGNWTDSTTGASQTGIYFRDTVASGGLSPVQKLAASGDTFDKDGQGTLATFGSTAPPSASDGRVAFTGLDNEAAPTAGGIFVSTLSDTLHQLKALVRIGVTAVGNGISETLRSIGEALSFDGGKIGFWGSWGQDTKSVTVNCPMDGNVDLVAECRNQDTSGIAGDGIYTFAVPVHQGFFLVDADSGALTMTAQTGGMFDDFLFWTFSGAPASAGDAEADQEPPRWRASSFVAVDGDRSVFKARNTNGATGLYADFGDGISTLLETGMDGGSIDPSAAGMQITSLGIERDGFRNGWLAINASMANADESWAGVYASHVPEPTSFALAAVALAGLGLTRRRLVR